MSVQAIGLMSGTSLDGIDLGRRMMNAQLFALTSPLISSSSGAKMGKTAAGAVWLDAAYLSPYDYWQYWRNTVNSLRKRPTSRSSVFRQYCQ